MPPDLLAHSIQNNDLQEVIRILSEDPTQLHSQVETGLGALDLAVELGHVAIIDHLLGLGADPNRAPDAMYGERPLIAAVLQGNVLIARRLLEAGADPDARDHYDYTPLQRAVMAQQPKLVELLITSKAALRFQTGAREGLVESSLSCATDEITAQLLASGALFKPTQGQLRELLTRAIERNQHRAAMALVDMGAPLRAPDHKQRSCVRHACEMGWAALAMALAERGADPYDAPDGYDWVANAGSDEVRRWREALQHGRHLEKTTAPVGAVARKTRL